MRCLVVCWLLLSCIFQAKALETIVLEPVADDMAPVLRKALAAVTDPHVRIVLKPGRYQFLPDYAESSYRVITNHGNGVKTGIFTLQGFDSVEIEGNGAELIFHGQVAPFQFYRNNKVTVRNLSIDWDIPFTFTAEVVGVNSRQGWVDLKPLPGNSYKLVGGELTFPNVDGFNYQYLGSTLYFDPDKKRVVHGAWDFKSKPSRVEKRGKGVFRLHEKLKHYPEVGMWWNSKGDRHNDRYAPAFQVRNSSNILIDGVKVHHALGMGFLFERSKDIQILNSAVVLKDELHGTRAVSSTADATHFANCGGNILIENSRFENMLDDGVNVHGTYVTVNKLLDKHTLIAELMHFEQQGFEFAAAGDEVWFIHQPDIVRQTTNRVIAVNPINEQFVELRFEHPLAAKLKVGDLLENKTWNPAFTLRNSEIGDHRARSIVLKTPEPILVEGNRFYSMMSCIFLRGESFYWYESGAVEDVTIRNNRFEHCAYSGKEHAVVYITPRLGRGFDATQAFDSNIRFINNDILTFDNRVVWADRVDGMTVTGNRIVKVSDTNRPPLHPNAPVFEFTNSHRLTIKDNDYQGQVETLLQLDETSQAGLRH